MKELSLGPWYPGTTNPVHVGVYECVDDYPLFDREYRKWDGRKWCSAEKTVEGALLRNQPTTIVILRWRGVLK